MIPMTITFIFILVGIAIKCSECRPTALGALLFMISMLIAFLLTRGG